MYVYRTGQRGAGRNTHRYFSKFDRVMVMLGLAAGLAFVGEAVATHGQSLVDTLQHAFGLH